MKKAALFAASLTLMAMAGACSDSADITGKWVSAAPVSVTTEVADARSAVSTLTFDFNKPTDGGLGELTLTADYDVTATNPTDSLGTTQYKAVATIKGTWVRDEDDSDDYLLSFDRNSLSVDGTNAPALGPVTDAFLNMVGRFTAIEDVELTKDGSHLSFETENPDTKYVFLKK